MMFLRRRAAFSAAHAYWFPERTDDENRRLFGPWASRWGHGHNYVVEATVAGAINDRTGMVVNITDIDQVLKRDVLAPLADKHLTYEVDHFRTTPPTLENIARYVAAEFNAHFTDPAAHLTRVTVWESPTLWVTLNIDKNMIALTRSLDFAAAHRLHAPALSDDENFVLFGKCDNPNGHGHNYVVEVTVTGDPDPTTGMLIDLHALDEVLKSEVMARFDHKHLNLDVADFQATNPTTENLTRVIWEHLQNQIPAPARLFRVVVRETERNAFEYYGESGAPAL